MSYSDWTLQAQNHLEELEQCTYRNICLLHSPPHRSLYAGGAGIAYAFWKAACLLEAPQWLHHARLWIDRVAAAPEEDEVQDIPDMPGQHFKLHVKDSLYFGNRGISFVQALISHSENNEIYLEQALKDFTRPESKRLSVQELFRGIAGRLVGCTLLYRETGSDILKKHGDRLTKRLLATAQGSSGQSPWQKNHRLGLAHGRAGNYYALLLWSKETGYVLPEWMHLSLQRYARSGRKQNTGVSWPIDERNESEYMNSWCNGAPGLILLWSLAYRVYEDPLFLHTAKEAGRYCEQQREYPVGHICCGAAGVSYAFLALQHIDPTHSWRGRAVRYSELARKGLMDRYSRFSLYKGLAGIVCLMLDMEFDGEIALPALEG
jgi:lantibiotic modifying enzyme